MRSRVSAESAGQSLRPVPAFSQQEVCKTLQNIFSKFKEDRVFLPGLFGDNLKRGKLSNIVTYRSNDNLIEL